MLADYLDIFNMNTGDDTSAVNFDFNFDLDTGSVSGLSDSIVQLGLNSDSGDDENSIMVSIPLRDASNNLLMPASVT